MIANTPDEDPTSEFGEPTEIEIPGKVVEHAEYAYRLGWKAGWEAGFRAGKQYYFLEILDGEVPKKPAKKRTARRTKNAKR